MNLCDVDGFTSHFNFALQEFWDGTLKVDSHNGRLWRSLNVPSLRERVYRSLERRKIKLRETEDVLEVSFLWEGEFTCPITLRPFVNPVVASDGHTYERDAIEHVIKTTKKSPLTRETLKHTVYRNFMLEKLLEQYSC